MPQRDTRAEMKRRAGGGNEILAYALLALLAVAGAVLGAVWVAGRVVAAATGAPYAVGAGQIVRAVLSPRRAGEVLGVGSTWAVWTIAALLLAVVVAVIVSIAVRAHRRTVARLNDVRRQEGLPDAGRIRREYGARQIVKRRRQLRPDFTPAKGQRVGVCDLSYLDGTSKGVPVYTSFETPTMLLAPSRVGKTQNVIAPRVVETRGAVLSTSTKTELVRLTWDERAKLGGPMMICDPEGVGAEAGLPGTVRWSLWSGCEEIPEAIARARVLAAGGSQGVKNGDFWEATTRRVFTPLLHAAALDPDVTMEDFQRWCFDPKNAQAALEILRESRGAGDLAAMLASVLEMDDAETRANMWAPVSNVGMALVDRRARETFGVGGDQLDIDAYLRESGTLYLIAQDGGNAGALILTLVDAIWRRAVVRANGAPGGRMEPPMHLSLDEIGNIGTLPALPRMMSEGGGLGIQTTAGFQSLAQAEVRYGAAIARTLWEAATQRVVLGGVVDDQVLTAMSRIAGTRTVVRESVSSPRRGEQAGRSYSEHREQVLEKDMIETMPRGIGVVVEATKPLIVVEFEPYFRRYGATKGAKVWSHVRRQIEDAAPEEQPVRDEARSSAR